MRGFDTNVLVRFLVRDDPRQAAIVDRVINEVVAEETVAFLDTVVLCETVWVLEDAYGYGKSEIADAIEKLLLTQQFEFEERDNVWRVLKRFRDGKADFSDYLIGEKNLANGCDRTSTFDKALRGESGFEVLLSR